MQKVFGLLAVVTAILLITDPFVIHAKASSSLVFSFTGIGESGSGSTHGVGGTLALNFSGGTNEDEVKGGTTAEVLTTTGGRGTAGVSSTSASTSGSTTGTTSSSTTGTTASSTSSTTSSSTTGTQHYTFQYYIYIANNATSPGSWSLQTDSKGDSPTYTSGAPPSFPTGWGTPSGYWTYNLGTLIETNPTPPAMSDSIPTKYLFGATATSGSQTLQVCFVCSGYYMQWQEIPLSKLAALAQSVDSRMMYGQPNAQGVAGAQASAPERNVIFSSWFYNGGLFSGHVSYPTGDQSGTSRVQAYVTPPVSGTTIYSSCLTLYYLTSPTAYNGSYTLETYMPNANDTNLNTALSALNWSNAWAIPTASGNQLSSTSMPPSAASYLNFNITSDTDLTSAGTMPVLLAMDPEPQPQSSPNVWSYYVSQTYANQNSSAVDQNPRAWFATQGSHVP